MSISKNMLVNSVVVFTPQGLDTDRNPTFDEGVELNNVYVTNTRAQANGSEGKTPADSLAIYYDIKNSVALAEGFTWSKGQRVAFDGVNYTVNSITPCYSLMGLHHYEIGLV